MRADRHYEEALRRSITKGMVNVVMRFFRFSAISLFVSFFALCSLLFTSSVDVIGLRGKGSGAAMAAGKSVVIEEYMSLTCPHCATFHREIYPQLLRGVLSSEHVSFRYRDFPLDRVSLQGAILSRCGGTSLRDKLVGAIMDRQDKLFSSDTPTLVLIGVLQLVGIDEARARACLSDKSLERAVLEEQLEGKRLYDISSTPSVVVAGKKMTGRLSAEKITDAVNDALSRAGLPLYKP